mgnify:CR=1 FL=1
MLQTIHKLYTNPTLNPTQRAFQTLHWGVSNPTQNPARNLMLKFEKPFPLGRGWGRLPPKKTNNFERFFGDSTLTFLTFRNTYRLLILPTRRLVLLRGRERKIWGRQIKIRGRQIFPGCASKSPILKGKWRKKGGAEAPPISLYKYNTFHRQKQEVLKPKKGFGCGKCFGEMRRLALFWRKDKPLFSVEVHAVCFIFRKVCASGASRDSSLISSLPF